MTAIRKTTLQVAYFQDFTNLITDLCTSNDRFGLKMSSQYCPLLIVFSIFKSQLSFQLRIACIWGGVSLDFLGKSQTRGNLYNIFISTGI